MGSISLTRRKDSAGVVVDTGHMVDLGTDIAVVAIAEIAGTVV